MFYFFVYFNLKLVKKWIVTDITIENYFSGTGALELELEKMKKIIEKQEADLNDERVSLNKILLEKIKKMEVFKIRYSLWPLLPSDFQCLRLVIFI